MPITKLERTLISRGKLGKIKIAETLSKTIEVQGLAWAEVFGLPVVEPGDDVSVKITHLPTGWAISKPFDSYGEACLAIVRALHQLGWNDHFEAKDIARIRLADTATEAAKIKSLRACNKYFNKWAEITNKGELENQIGVLYGEREDCERLRWKINPKAKKVLRDELAIGNERLTAEMISGDVALVDENEEVGDFGLKIKAGE